MFYTKDRTFRRHEDESQCQQDKHVQYYYSVFVGYVCSHHVHGDDPYVDPKCQKGSKDTSSGR